MKNLPDKMTCLKAKYLTSLTISTASFLSAVQLVFPQEVAQPEAIQAAPGTMRFRDELPVYVSMEDKPPTFGHYEFKVHLHVDSLDRSQSIAMLASLANNNHANLVINPVVTRLTKGLYKVEADAVLFDQPEKLRKSNQRFAMFY